MIGIKGSTEQQEPAVMVDRLLNQDEVAELLKVSAKTLEYWRYKGTGPRHVKVGKLARYRESDIQSYIAQLNN